MKINYINTFCNNHNDKKGTNFIIGYENGLLCSFYYGPPYFENNVFCFKYIKTINSVNDNCMFEDGRVIDLNKKSNILESNIYAKEISYFGDPELVSTDSEAVAHEYMMIDISNKLYINGTYITENVEKTLNTNMVLLKNGDIIDISKNNDIYETKIIKTNIKNLKKLTHDKIYGINKILGLLDNGDFVSIKLENNEYKIDETLIKNCKDIKFSYDRYPGNYCFVLTNNNEVYCIGDNSTKLLGVNNDIVNRLTKIDYVSDVKEIYISDHRDFTLLLLNNGDLLLSGKSFSYDVSKFTKVLENIKLASLTTICEYPIVVVNNDDEINICYDGSTNSFLYPKKIDMYNNFKSSKICKCVLGQILNNTMNNTQISKSHTLYLKDNGNIMTCGNNQFGQLGLGDTTDRNVLTKVPNISNVKQVCCGDTHSMILYNNGTIATCGNNRFGQLGLGNNENKNTFTKVPGITNVEQISCGGNSSMVKLTDGTIMTCGDNTVGQLCLGDNKNRNTFTKIII